VWDLEQMKAIRACHAPEVLLRLLTMRPEWPATSDWKKYWLLSDDWVFLNHGSFGACPKVVLEAQSKLRELMESTPVQFLWRHHDERLDAARRALADFLGADALNLAFVTNATTGVNAVLRSLKFQPGDEILTTNHDYNACRNVLEEAAGRCGAKVVVAEIPFPLQDEEEILTTILKSVTPRTRLAMIDHITSNTAIVFPVGRIIRELEALGIDTLVDGAHAPGMLPLALENLRPAYYTGNLHKWTCAPKGSAFLWIRPDKQEAIHPAVISHGHNTPRAGHSKFQDRFDWAGTHDLTAWLCVPSALTWIRDFLPGGWPAIMERNRSLLLNARHLICDRLSLRPPCPESLLGSMATLPLPGRLSQSEGRFPIDPLYSLLADGFGIEAPIIHFNDQRWIRISAHLHNTLDEYRYLADSLEKIAHS